MKYLLNQIVILFLASLGIFGCNEQGEKSINNKRPNIILCMSDDQGWGDMEYYEHPVLKTPNFNHMAENGLQLDRFYAASPVCSPTRASVLTGRHGNRMGSFSYGYPIVKEEITLAQILKDNGYSTAHFGKWHLGSVHKDSDINPGKMGFEYWLSAVNFFDLDPLLSRNGKIERISGEGSDILVEEALEYINQQENQDKPYLVVIWFSSPHNPHITKFRNRWKYFNQPTDHKNFYAEISALDDAMGKLRKGIKQTSNSENTLLWYCGDNGGLDYYGRNGGRGSKGAVYEGGLRVPGIIEWPAYIKNGSRSKYPVTTSDIFPTVLDICNIENNNSRPIDGISISNLIKYQMDSVRPKPIGFWQFDLPGSGRVLPKSELMDSMYVLQEEGLDTLGNVKPFLTKNRIKRIHMLKGRAVWLDWPLKFLRIRESNGPLKFELYDLEKDPYERENRYYSNRVKADSMKKQLSLWQKSVIRSYAGKDYLE